VLGLVAEAAMLLVILGLLIRGLASTLLGVGRRPDIGGGFGGHGGGFFGVFMLFRLAGGLLRLWWSACVLVGEVAVAVATWVGRHVAHLGAQSMRRSARRLDDDSRRWPNDRL
jgi:hypothetical protein